MVKLSEQLNEALAQFRSQTGRQTEAVLEEARPAVPVGAHR
jgi:hypothetical protein